MTHTKSLALIGLLALGAGACVEVGIPASGNKPHGELNPIQGMHASPAYKDQEAQRFFDVKSETWELKGMRQTPNEAVPVNFRPYPYKGKQFYKDENGEPIAVPRESKRLKNPVAITAQSLAYGKLMYETNCIVCHGPQGYSNGYVVGQGKYPKGQIPLLVSANTRSMEDGEIYHIITHGRNAMWAYKNNLYPLERWSVVNYIRALQRADAPEPQDIESITE